MTEKAIPRLFFLAVDNGVETTLLVTVDFHIRVEVTKQDVVSIGLLESLKKVYEV